MEFVAMLILSIAMWLPGAGTSRTGTQSTLIPTESRSCAIMRADIRASSRAT